MGVEYELKFAADPQTQQCLYRAMSGPWQKIEMETTYYDTPSGALQALHITLRRRFENGRSICTVKTPKEGFGRGEWETECQKIEEAIPVLCKLGAPEQLISLTQDGLMAVCGAKFTRLASTADALDGTVELALDEGFLFAGDRRQPLCEVEVEMKTASAPATAAFAKLLAERYSLLPEQRSKFRRALDLTKEK